MSRLIYTGDTVERFGKRIPTPFIEKIKIFEDEIEADISIYLHITDDDNTNHSIYDDLSNLKLYAGFGVIYQIPDSLNLGTNFLLVDDNIYNDEGKRFAKFTYSRKSSDKELEDFAISRAESDSTNTETYYSCFIAISKDENGIDNRDLHFFRQPNEFDKQGIYGVFRNLSSPLVYEKVFTAPLDGSSSANRLATDPISIYTDSSNIPYKETPLKSIQKNYHKTTLEFRNEIKIQLANLVASFENTTDQQVQSFRDSISFMAETMYREAEFLTELDAVRNSFPSRTSTSELGILYNAFKNIIFAANDAVVLEDQVTKEIVPNTKLIDLRGYFVSEEQEWERKNFDTYEPRVDDTGDILYPNVFMERQQLETKKFVLLNADTDNQVKEYYDAQGTLVEPDFDITSIFGYFFFDYEKALHKKSNISQIYEVQKLLNIWGNNLLDSYFSLKKAEMLRFHTKGFTVSLVRKITTPYVDNRPFTNLILNSSRGQEDIFKVIQNTIDENEEVVETTDIPYVMLRGFDTVEGLNGYRLLAFEFQDFEEASVSFRPGGSYRFNVFVDDNTLDFYDFLVEGYEQSLTELKDYLSKAEDFCSFNNIDNRFNEFFVTAIKEQYGDESNYPWINAPKLFAIHLDLINDLFSGIAERMSQYASNLSALTSPENGTLLALQNLVNDMDEFYEKYYGIEGEITKLISSRRDPDGNLVPSLKDNTEFAATLGYDNFPDVVDFTVDIEPPPKLKLWNGFEILLLKNPTKFFINTRTATMAMARSKGDSYKEFVDSEKGGLITLESLEAVFEKGILRKILSAVSGGGLTSVVAGVIAGTTQASTIGVSAGTGAALAFGGTATATTGTVAGSAVAATAGATTAALGGAVIATAAIVALIIVMIVDRSKRQRVRRITRFINKFVSRIQNQSEQLTYDGKKALIERELRLAFGDRDDRPEPYKDLSNNDIEFLQGEKARIGNIGLLTIGSTQKEIYDVSRWLTNKTKNVRTS